MWRRRRSILERRAVARFSRRRRLAPALRAALAGVGFVAAAAGLWCDRRRREVTLLTVRGVSPAALGLKAILELIVPLTAGAVGGGRRRVVVGVVRPVHWFPYDRVGVVNADP